MQPDNTARPDHPELDLTGFPVKAPEYFNFAYDVIDYWAKKDRNKQCMIWTNQFGDERRFTFFEMSRLANQAANLLIKQGIRRGDRVFVMVPRLPEWWIFSLAMIRIGAVQCPSPSLLTPEDCKYRITAGNFKAVISDMSNTGKFDEIYDDCPTLQARILVDGEKTNWISYREEVQSGSLSREELHPMFRAKTKATDPMIIMFTSGTSSHPKMVLHSHDLALGHRVTALWHGSTSNDVQLTISDTGWAKNLWGNYFGQWCAGACLLIYDIRGKFHPEELLPLMEKYEVTRFCAPPTIYRMLVLSDLSKFNLSQLVSCTAAGEPLHTETVRMWKAGTGITIREAYGQTETCCIIGNFPGEEPVLGSMGKPSPGWHVELHDENGEPVPVGEDGRIAIKITPECRPVGLIREYLDDEAANKDAFVGDFYYTGDKARLDENGNYWFVGRSDDIIKSSGYRIGPLEVEEVIMKHPAVVEVAVIGVSDPMRGTRVKAYIILKDGYTGDEALIRDIQEFAKLHTAPYKYPREIEFVRALPKTVSGKVKRDLLRRHSELGEDIFANLK